MAGSGSGPPSAAIGLDGDPLILPAHLVPLLGQVATVAEPAVQDLDGVYEFFYAAAPLKVALGSGSPVNPLVVK